MRSQLFSIAATVLLLTACNAPIQEKADVPQEEIEKLHLNDGQKWTVNDATHIGMTNIQSLLTSVADSANYDSLAVKMAHETQYIITNCDMVGKDHDQLHLVLHPILTNIKAVKSGTDLAIRKEGVSALQKNLSDYFSHFQTK